MLDLTVRRITTPVEPLGFADRVHQVMTRNLARLAGQAQRNLRDNGSVATGELRRSVHVGIDYGAGGDLLGWIGFELYGVYLETGTVPHWPPITTPGGGGILRWVKAKGLVAATPEFKGKRRSGTYTKALTMPEAVAHGLVTFGMGSKAEQRTARAALALHGRYGHLEGEALRSASALDQAEMRVAFAVAASIAAHGTKAHPWLVRAVETVWRAHLLPELEKLGRGH